MPDSEESNIIEYQRPSHVCLCLGVSESEIVAAIRQGADTVEKLGEQTGAGTHCGTCRPRLQFILERELGRK